MNALAAKLIKNLLAKTSKGKKLLQCWQLQPYLDEVGWLRSVEEGMCVDRDGGCLPWFPYPVISFLNTRVQPDMTVFEYGSGNSTFWWSEKVSRVVSYEHNFDWYNYLKDRLPPSVEYQHRNLEYGGEYCKAVLGYEKEFDIVVLDGRDRVNCARNAIHALRSNGIIIWDNTERDNYQEGYAFLMRNQFRRIDLEGLGPINNYKWRTSIFYRDGNCFGI